MFWHLVLDAYKWITVPVCDETSARKTADHNGQSGSMKIASASLLAFGIMLTYTNDDSVHGIRHEFPR